jgi:hypothetical protein
MLYKSNDHAHCHTLLKIMYNCSQIQIPFIFTSIVSKMSEYAVNLPCSTASCMLLMHATISELS